ncbi:MAG: hypothetical protein ACOC46_00095 [Pirellulales bacterium]
MPAARFGRHRGVVALLAVTVVVGGGGAGAGQGGFPPPQPGDVVDADTQPRALPPLHPGTIIDATMQPEADAAPVQPRKASGGPTAAEQPQPADPAVPAPAEDRPTGPRDLLRRLNVDDSYFDHLQDGVPLRPSEDEVVLQLLDRLPQFRREDIARWAEPIFPLKDVLASPEPHRGQIFWLAGRVSAVKPVELIPEVADRYGSWGYWWCTMRLAGKQAEATVLTRRVPDAWKRTIEQDRALDERATAYGMFVKFASDSPERPQPMFAARRIAWHPPTPLGNLGFDVGLLDEVRNARPLSGGDRQAFYAMLASVGRAEPGHLMRLARARLKTASAEAVRTDDQGDRHWSVVPLFNDPEKQHGKLFFLEGTVRRAERIEVHDPDIRARFGIDHYYQLALFPPDSRDRGGHRNPVWFCVRDVPEEMPLGAEADYTERVRVAGFFLKTWAYRRGMLPEEEGGGPPMQLAPLLIGREPIYLPPPAPVGMHPMVGLIAGGLFMAALAGIWIAVWRYNRADAAFQKRALAKNYQLDQGVSLNELGLEASADPDFSRLGQADSGPPSQDHRS